MNGVCAAWQKSWFNLSSDSFFFPMIHGTDNKGLRLLGVALFAITLPLCVGKYTPADSHENPHWTPVKGSSSMVVGTPTTDLNGVKYYPVMSLYQGYRRQIIRVLEPTKPAPGKPHRYVYVLPVEARVTKLSSYWSDGLEELRLLNVPNRFNMTLIAPSFEYEPWYGDNDQDPSHRIESFIVKDLVPFGDSFAKDRQPERLLLGFSKSGFGALTLIFRHPDIFDAAAVWDSPTKFRKLSAFDALPLNFGTQQNLEHYNIASLISNAGRPFKCQNRLWIGADPVALPGDMTELHHLLMAHSIPHLWINTGAKLHGWESGWLNEAMIGLDRISSRTRLSNQGVHPAPPPCMVTAAAAESTDKIAAAD
ncbi:MAG TPA: alpha/beta hydrolase-fold protein [Terracidiphilus sp.]|nr:alpha/beta hydrolase-fold protein [Terracidiphilus sp.]